MQKYIRSLLILTSTDSVSKKLFPHIFESSNPTRTNLVQKWTPLELKEEGSCKKV